MAGRRGGTERVLSKLKASIENENYYEAHQMYRTLYFRYLGQKKYGELETMLFDGAVLLFSHDEVASGTDLSKLYVETLNQAEADPEEIHFLRISKLYQLMPCDNVDKPVYLTTCLKWSNKETGSPLGHPRLHQHIAYGLWQNKQYPESRQHFLQSWDGAGCGHMLVEYHQARGFNSEVDMFIAQTVLQYLCLKKSLAAATAFVAYTEQHPKIKCGPPYPHPLLNFLWFLLLSIQTSQSLSAYTVLCEKYKQFLDRDPQYLEYLDKIGQHFFGVPAPVKPRPGGMFSGLFDQLLNAMNEDSSDDESAGPSVQSGPSGTVRPSQPKPTSKFEAADLD
eukprot:TRINITY_DN8607_c0_g1_i1.p1 TRINITY_DN8607_c0_g1~~TRINITY_DN8607_c0_g1_i1.p1  ORF type:complete len:336 (-),score=102.85 TRINITY_DN8607_c0_g1_i1:173-1180(-)